MQLGVHGGLLAKAWYENHILTPLRICEEEEDKIKRPRELHKQAKSQYYMLIFYNNDILLSHLIKEKN